MADQLLPANPFVVESPERLSPDQIIELFVEEFTRVDTIKQRKHNFIWGSRGAGKSMMLRFLEPQCQILAAGDLQAFLGADQAFLAVYCPCKEGYFNKTEFVLLDPLTAKVLTEHMLNMYIAARVVDCINIQLPSETLSSSTLVQLAVLACNLFDPVSIASSSDEATQHKSRTEDPLGWLQTLFSIETRKINSYLRQNVMSPKSARYTGATSSYHDFLLPFVQAVSAALPVQNIPVYVMLDDADRLNRTQQLIVNSWIANRDQRFLCIKVAAEMQGYKTFKRDVATSTDTAERDYDLSIEGGGLIEAPHDYTDVDVDELYTQSKSDYLKKVRLIANRRLRASTSSAREIERFLPEDPVEAALFETIKRRTEDEWEKDGRPGDKGDYVRRYAMARLFQAMRDQKRKSYAGFTNMVHLSSGVVRSFLEPCYLMFDRCVSRRKGDDPIESIPPSVQDEVLLAYSQEFLLVEIEKIRRDLPPEHWSRLEALSTLLASLGRLFYERLHDRTAREARLFSFTVRGSLPEDIEAVLRLGVRYRYFQLRTYSSKEGGGREKWYILNRRLCPVFQLDPTGFEGRISLTPELLRLACESSERFVRLRLRQAVSSGQLDIFSLADDGDADE